MAEGYFLSAVREIVVPGTKPATESILGQAVQKVSPPRTHARLQYALPVQLSDWAQRRGEVGPEWRFGITPADRQAHVEHKRDVYIAAGVKTLTSQVFPDLTLSFADAFAKLDLPA
jgi:hypothetical protein